MVVNPNIQSQGTGDIYINDGISITVDLPGNIYRSRGEIPLVIHSLKQPLADTEYIPLHHLVSKSKLTAEAALTELLVILCWKLDTRKLQIKFPEHKWIAWRKTLSDMINRRSINLKEVETVVYCLTHLAIVIQQVIHFLSRIRQIRDRTKNRRTIKIPETVVKDFKLFIVVLDKA